MPDTEFKHDQAAARGAVDREIAVSARAVAMVLPFVGRDRRFRPALCGVIVEPHPAGDGVFCVATDGHRMAIAHDPNGISNGAWINPVPKLLADRVAAVCKPRARRARGPKIPLGGTVVFRGGYLDGEAGLEEPDGARLVMTAPASAWAAIAAAIWLAP